MKNLKEHARQMRREIFDFQLRTRGTKYRNFLRYLRLFKYTAFSPLRGTFLESYYTLMRYLDDIVDGDAPLPEGFADGSAYLEEKIRFSLLARATFPLVYEAPARKFFYKILEEKVPSAPKVERVKTKAEHE